jgi:hypothetical protein
VRGRPGLRLRGGLELGWSGGKAFWEVSGILGGRRAERRDAVVAGLHGLGITRLDQRTKLVHRSQFKTKVDSSQSPPTLPAPHPAH